MIESLQFMALQCMDEEVDKTFKGKAAEQTACQHALDKKDDVEIMVQTTKNLCSMSLIMRWTVFSCNACSLIHCLGQMRATR